MAVAEGAPRRISQLETQVQILTGKATAAGTLFPHDTCYGPAASLVKDRIHTHSYYGVSFSR